MTLDPITLRRTTITAVVKALTDGHVSSWWQLVDGAEEPERTWVRMAVGPDPATAQIVYVQVNVWTPPPVETAADAARRTAFADGFQPAAPVNQEEPGPVETPAQSAAIVDANLQAMGVSLGGLRDDPTLPDDGVRADHGASLGGPLADGVICKRCDLYVGYGAVGRMEPPAGTSTTWRTEHCWNCHRSLQEILSDPRGRRGPARGKGQELASEPGA
jgi:hypothetical protein